MKEGKTKKKYIPTQKKIARVAKECLELWKLACYKMWGDECIFSGTTNETTYHHYILKSKNVRLRFDPMNGVPMRNSNEHYLIHHGNNPETITDLYNEIRRKRGKKWCDYIAKEKAKDNYSFLTLRNITEQRDKLKKYLDN